VNPSSTLTNKSVKKDSYTKNYVLSAEKEGNSVKFFNNNFFRTHLQQYLSNTYNIECHIRLTELQDIDIELVGIKHNVKAARETIKNLFESVRDKIFNKEDTDQQSKTPNPIFYMFYLFHISVIYWSQHAISDSVIPVIQEIMDKERIFTLWEKTAMFSGYLKTIYLTQEPFATTVDRISEILTREISYIADFSMPNEKTKNFIKILDEFIFIKQHPELALIQCRYPFKTDIKISLFGRNNLIKKIKRQLQSIINKHTIQVYRLKLNSSQVRRFLRCSQQNFLIMYVLARAFIR
jgi:hypothetical protein